MVEPHEARVDPDISTELNWSTRVTVSLEVNGRVLTDTISPRVTLLD